MNNLDLMLKRNKESATPVPSLPQSLQTLKAVIIGCADMRVDPAHVLGIKPGEAVVMRNIGGRVTPGLLEEFGLLGRIGEVAGTIPGGGGEFHLIVLHHTDCGSTRLVGDPGMLAHYFQIPERKLRPSQSAIHTSQWRSTLLRSGRFRHCRTSGSSQALFMT
jgi:carbonic anhydrase